MAAIISAIGIALMCIGVIWLYGIALSRNIWLGLLSLVVPIILLVLIADEQGQKAWGCTILGVILSAIGFFMYNS